MKYRKQLIISDSSLFNSRVVLLFIFIFSFNPGLWCLRQELDLSYSLEFPKRIKSRQKPIREIQDFQPWDYFKFHFSELEKRVYLPAKEFQKLKSRYNGIIKEWEKVEKEKRLFSVGPTKIKGEVKGKVAVFSGTLDLFLSGDWEFIPLFPATGISLNNLKILSGKVDEIIPTAHLRPPRRFRLPQSNTESYWKSIGSHFFIKGKGRVELGFSFRVPVIMKKTLRQIQFSHLPFPSLSVRFQIPGSMPIKGYRDEGRSLKSDFKETFNIFSWESGGQKSTSFIWYESLKKKSKPLKKEKVVAAKKTRKKAIVFVEQEDFLSLAEGYLRGQVSFNLSISRHVIGSLTLKIPGDMTILDIQASFLRDFKEVSPGVMRLFFKRKISGERRFFILFEKTLEKGQRVISFSPITSLNVKRERGYLALVSPSTIKIMGLNIAKAYQQSLNRLDPMELPARLRAKALRPILIAYRFSSTKFSVDFRTQYFRETSSLNAFIERASIFSYATMENSAHMADFFLEHHQRQFLGLKLPPGAEFLHSFLNGKPVKTAKDEGGNLKIPLIQARRGRNRISISWIKPVQMRGMKGHFNLELPRLDIPVGSLDWTVAQPDNYHFISFKGSPELQQKKELFIYRHLKIAGRLLDWSIDRGFFLHLLLLLAGVFFYFFCFFKRDAIALNINAKLGGPAWLAQAMIWLFIAFLLFAVGSLALAFWNRHISGETHRDIPHYRSHPEKKRPPAEDYWKTTSQLQGMQKGALPVEFRVPRNTPRTILIKPIVMGREKVDTSVFYVHKWVFRSGILFAIILGIIWVLVLHTSTSRQFFKILWSIFMLIFLGRVEVFTHPMLPDICLGFVYIYFPLLLGVQSFKYFQNLRNTVFQETNNPEFKNPELKENGEEKSHGN
ncbi:hypothetical protein ACFL35_18950 [Candidatus Riflebacteria bacterium]